MQNSKEKISTIRCRVATIEYLKAFQKDIGCRKLEDALLLAVDYAKKMSDKIALTQIEIEDKLNIHEGKINSNSSFLVICANEVNQFKNLVFALKESNEILENKLKILENKIVELKGEKVE